MVYPHVGNLIILEWHPAARQPGPPCSWGVEAAARPPFTDA